MTPKNTTKSIVRVLITEGTRMASRLLADALSQQSSLEVVAATCGANESLLAVTEKRPDVILLSDGLEDDPKRGFELAKEIRLAAPEARVVLLLDNCRSETVVEAFRAGARGVFSRNESLAVLAKCVMLRVDGSARSPPRLIGSGTRGARKAGGDARAATTGGAGWSVLRPIRPRSYVPQRAGNYKR